ncbi:fatty acyl-CoA reductase 3 isoform X2 [Lactuca sativa]|uniref:fatty acyl-CoA reductase 3 isoform X2 n=1 Tax=Lactuca sativa TaxID=4236 RepID=UPI000CD9AAD9|nr:fatty acyl-CoA reductase 3 isoform X2 [Lactuca sativa]
MEMESIIEYLENKTILVTGATGFLAKILVEKILRIQPNINKLFLLIRASDSNLAMHRLHTEVLDNDLFMNIKEVHKTNFQRFISEKVMPVAGDIRLQNFGVTNISLLNEMRGQVNVVVSSAATTKFDERYDVALAINTLGVEHLSCFVNECPNMKLLLHVSTAFVSGEKSGIIFEMPFKMGETLNDNNNLDIREEKRLTQERQRQLIIEKANEEAMSSAMTDLGIQRTMDSFIAAYGKGRTSCFLAHPDKVLDIIPADMVINVMITAMGAHINKPVSMTIYHVGSSMSNPLKISTFKNCVIEYFAKHPLKIQQGNPIRTSKTITLLSSMSIFNRYMVIRYVIPLKVFKYVNIVLGRAFNAWYLDAERKINIIFRLASLYKPYVLINTMYDDTNLNKLHGISEIKTFFFDVKSLNWEDFFMNIHIPGLVKYALRK